MLPEIRHDEYLFSVPKFDINKEDIEDFHNELKGFHDNFRDCFSRSESREHFFKYMVGQFSELERKSIEPIALNIQKEDGQSIAGKVRAMQRRCCCPPERAIPDLLRLSFTSSQSADCFKLLSTIVLT